MCAVRPLTRRGGGGGGVQVDQQIFGAGISIMLFDMDSRDVRPYLYLLDPLAFDVLASKLMVDVTLRSNIKLKLSFGDLNQLQVPTTCRAPLCTFLMHP